MPPQYRVLSGTFFSLLQVQLIRSTRLTSKQTCPFRSSKSENLETIFSVVGKEWAGHIPPDELSKLKTQAAGEGESELRSAALWGITNLDAAHHE